MNWWGWEGPWFECLMRMSKWLFVPWTEREHYQIPPEDEKSQPWSLLHKSGVDKSNTTWYTLDMPAAFSGLGYMNVIHCDIIASVNLIRLTVTIQMEIPDMAELLKHFLQNSSIIFAFSSLFISLISNRLTDVSPPCFWYYWSGGGTHFDWQSSCHMLVGNVHKDM